MRFKPRLSFYASFFLVPLVFSALTLGHAQAPARSSRQSAKALYFSPDEPRLEKILGRKDLLGYRVALSEERRYRETFFDTPALQLYQRGMFYRVRESFDGQAQIDLYTPGQAMRPAAGLIQSVTLSPGDISLARQGKVTEARLSRKLREVSGGPDVNVVHLVAEYAAHGIILERGGRRDYAVHLLVGTFEGLTGRSFRKPFWAVEISALAVSPTEKQARELDRMGKQLAAELELDPQPRTLYTEGIGKAVLVRSDERLLSPLRIIGGTRGKSIEQFDMPDAVAFTLDGKLVAGDTDNARIKIYKLDERAQTVRIVGREGSRPGEFDHSVATTVGGRPIHNQVQGITVDRNGLVYVIDQGNRRIQVFDAEGNALPDRIVTLHYCGKENPRCADGLARPSNKGEYTSVQGLAGDHDGALFLSDKGMSRIYRFLPDGKIDPGFKLQEVDLATGKPILKEPESMAVYQDRLFVANEGTGEIKIFHRRSGKLIGAPQGFGAEVFGGDVEGLAVHGDYLFAVDVQKSRIAVFDLKSERPTFLSAFVGEFESADGIAIDPTGRFVAIADQGNLRIVLYSLPEILETLKTLKPKG